MKTSINQVAIWATTILILMSISFTPALGQSKADKKAVALAVENFAKAGDERDIDLLEQVLHPEFRVVLNGAFGSDEVGILNRDSYLAMAKEGKIGGVERQLKVKEVDIVHNNATVKAELSSTEMYFIARFALVKTLEGKWQIIQDLPFVQKK